MEPGEVTGGGLVPLSDTIDQSSKLEVKMLDAKTLAKGRRRYLKLERTDPPDDENPTEEHLTALFAAVFTS